MHLYISRNDDLMKVIKKQTEQIAKLYQAQAEPVAMLKRHRGRRGRGSSSSRRSRQSQSQADSKLNPWRGAWHPHGSKARSSAQTSPTYQWSYRNSEKRDTLLETWRWLIMGGWTEERRAEDRETCPSHHNEDRGKRKSSNLPSRPDSPRHVIELALVMNTEKLLNTMAMSNAIAILVGKGPTRTWSALAQTM